MDVFAKLRLLMLSKETKLNIKNFPKTNHIKSMDSVNISDKDNSNISECSYGKKKLANL